MARIYFKNYMARVDKNEITIFEAISLVEQEVPERWREAVIALLEAQE